MINILIVDDLRLNRQLVRAHLKKIPSVMDMAENGMVALEKMKNNNYDLVLMDVEMPEMDGLTATRELRKWEKEQGKDPTLILALTAHAFKSSEKKSREAGCDGHLVKPIRKQVLLDAIRSHLQKRKNQT